MTTVITVVGIRPDFIRMSEVFKRLDEDPDVSHLLVHTGQHYDKLMSGVFFDEMNIREPDHNLCCGGFGDHIEQGALRDKSLFKLIESLGLDKRDTIFLFLGDSNSVLSAIPLRKDGWKVGHIEAGQRSGDMTMLEECNRICCDVVSNVAFCYHDDFIKNLRKENYRGTALNVGNTIVEPTKKYGKFRDKKKEDYILLDIHRPENFNNENRLRNTLAFAELCSKWYDLPILMLSFGRTMGKITENEITLGKSIEVIPLVGYRKFLELQYHAKFMISDSGTAQEEPALLDTPVLVPRNYTERPQSVINKCSTHISVDTRTNTYFMSNAPIEMLLNRFENKCTNWLGSGNTSYEILYELKRFMK